MKTLKLLSCLPLLFVTFFASAQINPDSVVRPVGAIETRELFKRKGTFFFYWGYNRAAFSNSDIRLWGDGYDFKITNVSALDEPDKLSKEYIGPGTFTVPQYNYRLGYYLTDKIYVSIGEDHMKYHIVPQTTHLSGSISKDNNGGANIGNYNNQEVLVGEGEDDNPGKSIIQLLPQGFVPGFEHCDGLNDASFEIGRLEQIWMSKNGKDALSVVGGVGAGMVIPDSDVDVLGYEPKHDMDTGKKSYHLAGYSGSLHFGLQFDFCKHFFLLAKLKTGYINLPDILTTTTGGKASQHFTFIEEQIVLAYTFSFKKHKK